MEKELLSKINDLAIGNFSISLGQAIFKCFWLASRWGLPSGLGCLGQSS
jgi:hypothetical protein